jgi:hypothetical protein
MPGAGDLLQLTRCFSIYHFICSEVAQQAWAPNHSVCVLASHLLAGKSYHFFGPLFPYQLKRILITILPPAAIMRNKRDHRSEI